MQHQGSTSMQGQGEGPVKADGPRSTSNRSPFDGSEGKGQGKGHGIFNAGNPNVMNQNRGGLNQGAHLMLMKKFLKNSYLARCEEKICTTELIFPK